MTTIALSVKTVKISDQWGVLVGGESLCDSVTGGVHVFDQESDAERLGNRFAMGFTEGLFVVAKVPCKKCGELVRGIIGLCSDCYEIDYELIAGLDLEDALNALLDVDEELDQRVDKLVEDSYSDFVAQPLTRKV